METKVTELEIKDRFINFKSLKDYGITFSRTHLRRLEENGEFPKRINISSARVVWLESEIYNFIRNQAKRRDKAIEEGILK